TVDISRAWRYVSAFSPHTRCAVHYSRRWELRFSRQNRCTKVRPRLAGPPQSLLLFCELVAGETAERDRGGGRCQQRQVHADAGGETPGREIDEPPDHGQRGPA